MGLQKTPYTLPLILATGGLVGLAFYIWRRRAHVARARTGVLLLLAGALWTVTYALELSGITLEAKIFWSKMQYPGIAVVPTAWLVYALQYTDHENWLSRRRLLLLNIVPLVTILLVFTNEAHGLIWLDTALNTEGPFFILEKSYGAGFWVFFVYAYALVLLGAFFFTQAFARSHQLYRSQINALFLAASMLFLASALGRFGWKPFPGLQLEPFAFGVIGLIVAWGLFRLRLGDILPVARDAIVESMSDAVIILDTQSRVIDLNPAARRFIGPLAAEAVGCSIARVLARHPDLVALCYDATASHTEIVVQEGERKCHYDTRVSPLYDRHGRLGGRLLVFRDITERVRSEGILRSAEAEARKQLQDQTLLREAAALISSTLDLSTVLTHIAEQMHQAVDATSAYICDFDMEKMASTVLAAHYSPQAPERKLASEPGASYEQEARFLEKLQTGQFSINHVDDPDLPDHMRTHYRKHGAQTVVYIPLRRGDQVIGYVELWESRRRREFEPEEMALCQAIAQNAAIAIENARLYEQAQQELSDRTRAEEALLQLNEELERRVKERTAELIKINEQRAHEIDERRRTETTLLQRNRELLSLQSATAATTSSLDLLFVLETVTWEMVNLLGVSGCTISEWDEEADTLSVIAEYHSKAGKEERLSTKTYDLADYPLKKRALIERSAEQITVSYAQMDTGELTFMKEANIETLLMLPMVFQSRVVGLVELSDSQPERTYTDHEISLTQFLTNQAAIAIENARLYERAQEEIAERKRAEEQIRASLKEKEVLLQEVHHRVKNNLQVVSSLLNLQSNYVQDVAALEMFKESQNRILSMALIHEKLYRSQDLARIDLGEYIEALASDLVRSYRSHAGPINLNIDASDVFLSVEQAVPCGLVINELVSNALKHAFPVPSGVNGRESEIRVELSASPERHITLVVADNGIGFPQDLNLQDTDSLGLRLVNTLVGQLDGRLELKNHDGTEFRLSFTAA